MPLFEYKCLKCNYKFEELISGATPEKGIVCPKCGSGSVAKQLSVFAVGRAEEPCGIQPDGTCDPTKGTCQPGTGACRFNP